MNNYFHTLDDKSTKPKRSRIEGLTISEILDMSQDITGNWLNKQAEEKIIIQEQVQAQKDNVKHKK